MLPATVRVRVCTEPRDMRAAQRRFTRGRECACGNSGERACSIGARPLLLPGSSVQVGPIARRHVCPGLAGKPHYGAGLWAFSQNSLTNRISSRPGHVRGPSHRSRTCLRANATFHVVPRNSHELGVVNEMIEGMHVPVSDPERTLVDLLERPRIAGGLRPALQLFTLGLPRVTVSRVAEYASRIARNSTCQRIGLLLERAGARPFALRRIERRTRGTKSLISLEPGPRTGRVNVLWSVVEDDHELDAPASS